MEKFTTEMIEQYLEDTLNVNTRLEMEAAMALNPELKEEVLIQKALVQRIEEQALRTLAQDAHLRYMKGNDGSGFFFNGKWIFGITLLIVAVAGMVNVFNSNLSTKEVSSVGKAPISGNEEVRIADKEQLVLPVVHGVVEKTNENFPEVPFTAYTFLAEKGAQIKDVRSGAVIKIPANILIHKNGSLVIGSVVLKYREFRTQADIALSRIPMTYKSQNFNSAGMFEMYAIQNGDTLSINNQGAVSIDFVMTKNEAGIGFYELDGKKKQWEFIRALTNQYVVEGFLDESHNLEGNKVKMNFPQESLKDAFVRSLGYQKATMEGKIVIPELPRKMSELYADKNYKQIAGSEKDDLHRIYIGGVSGESGGGGGGNGGSGFLDFFKRIFSKRQEIAKPVKDKSTANADTSLNIVVNNKPYTIYEPGKKIVLTELSSLKGAHFIYKGIYDFSRLTDMEFYDVRFVRDTTVQNRFILELKSDGKFLKFPLLLDKSDFTAFSEYDKQRGLRMLTYDSRVKLKEKEYQELIELRKERKDLVDSLSFYGNENIFRMARLIMTENELKMTQKQWFASLDTSKALRVRINAHLDSIEAYGDNADVYIDKLAKERNENIENYKTSRSNYEKIYDPQYASAGHYFNPLVANLKINNFGVYNCDQVYRIQNPISVKGKYVTEDNVDIKNFIGISLIDPQINAAFSFDPRLFICSSTGNNMILLFAKNNKIYFFDKAKWNSKQIKKDGSYTFEMVDITAKVKTSADLQRILEATPL